MILEIDLGRKIPMYEGLRTEAVKGKGKKNFSIHFKTGVVAYDQPFTPSESTTPDHPVVAIFDVKPLLDASSLSDADKTKANESTAANKDTWKKIFDYHITKCLFLKDIVTFASYTDSAGYETWIDPLLRQNLILDINAYFTTPPPAEEEEEESS